MSEAPPPPRSLRSVLVVDDEPLVARGVARILRPTYAVDVETDSRRALARLLGGETFDVILCDLAMPGLNGMDCLRALEAGRPEQAKKVVFISGGAVTTRTQEFLDSAGVRRLDKPFTIEELRAVLDDVIGG